MDKNKLDDWAIEPKVQRKLIWVDEDFRSPIQVPHIGGHNIPDGYRPETDAEFRERIKQLV